MLTKVYKVQKSIPQVANPIAEITNAMIASKISLPLGRKSAIFLMLPEFDPTINKMVGFFVVQSRKEGKEIAICARRMGKQECRKYDQAARKKAE